MMPSCLTSSITARADGHTVPSRLTEAPAGHDTDAGQPSKLTPRGIRGGDARCRTRAAHHRRRVPFRGRPRGSDPSARPVGAADGPARLKQPDDARRAKAGVDRRYCCTPCDSPCSWLSCSPRRDPGCEHTWFSLAASTYRTVLAPHRHDISPTCPAPRLRPRHTDRYSKKVGTVGLEPTNPSHVRRVRTVAERRGERPRRGQAQDHESTGQEPDDEQPYLVHEHPSASSAGAEHRTWCILFDRWPKRSGVKAEHGQVQREDPTQVVGDYRR